MEEISSSKKNGKKAKNSPKLKNRYKKLYFIYLHYIRLPFCKNPAPFFDELRVDGQLCIKLIDRPLKKSISFSRIFTIAPPKTPIYFRPIKLFVLRAFLENAE